MNIQANRSMAILEESHREAMKKVAGKLKMVTNKLVAAKLDDAATKTERKKLQAELDSIKATIKEKKEKKEQKEKKEKKREGST